MAEEPSLNPINAKIEKMEANLTASADVLMCLMEIVSDLVPEARQRILDKLKDAVEAAEAIERPDVAKEIWVIRASFRSA